MSTPTELHIEPATRERAAVIILLNLAITGGILVTIAVTGTVVPTLNLIDIVFESASAITALALFIAATLVKINVTSRPALLLGLFLFQLGRGLDVADEVVYFDSTLWSVTGDALALCGEIMLAAIAFTFVRRSSRLMNADPLTRLNNGAYHRRLLNTLLKTAAKKHSQIAVLSIDIDHFKKVNDEHGHAIGDLVLKRVADTLRQSANATEVVSRTGGEEFEILVPNTTAEMAMQRAEIFRKALADNPPPPLTRLTASIGIALGGHPAALNTVRQQADEAAYQSKKTGRNKVTLASQD